MFKGEIRQNQIELYCADPKGLFRDMKKGLPIAILMTPRIGHSKEPIFY